MKSIKVSLVALTIATAGLFAFKGIQTGSIKGTVSPADGAERVWALSGTDTLKATVESGAFNITGAKAGTYRVIVEAKPPYKNAAKDGVTVTDGQPTDVGEIKLEQ
ncbi:carboxypeptidase-like regulatory domain-containing protein [Pseudobacter ginsenosidimutans]|uniref:Carboxypeptidase family protein n=1 Tax=Pseudobacter ginsenosidimutans TaxID=661488 RepID=A0A4Q7N0G5_9BACT|nr:carboxypeptidase-like regulatory domain-containing protein [Pseudobacter ginsenosidimutans]QEC43688.1 carboxypeptidase regulatory-like domain-containing protein [Pseudobacter ginsenosidimutans]RZS75091.1 carboxypeptidase family protein [Pseudobacter ginsenosidimutans]